MRVVIEHTQGTRAGLHQILGTVDQVKADMQVAELPGFIADISFGDRINSASLVGINRSYVLYRELITPEGIVSTSFHPSQL